MATKMMPCGHLVLHERVVGDHPAADAAGREDVAHGQAAERDRRHLAQAHADVEHAQDVAEEVGVAGQRGDLERDGGREQHVARARDVLDGLLGVDEPRQQQIQRQHDDREDDDVSERLLDGVSPRVGGPSRQGKDSTTECGAVVRRRAGDGPATGRSGTWRGRPGSAARTRSRRATGGACGVSRVAQRFLPPRRWRGRRALVAEQGALDLLAAGPRVDDRRRDATERDGAEDQPHPATRLVA